jgi:Protein of unknown function (DUF541)
VKRIRMAIVAAVAGLSVLASGTIGFALGRDGNHAGTAVAGTNGRAPEGAVSAADLATTATRPAASAGMAAGKAAVGFPGAEFPGLPPFPAQAPESDGVHAVGVAYRKTDDPNTKPGQDLVRQAFDDATTQARELAGAAGVKLGKLVALSDVRQTQPFYNACVTPLAGPKANDLGSPPVMKPGLGDEASPAPSAPAILPAPAPGSPPDCSPTWYVVAWVFVRYELA